MLTVTQHQDGDGYRYTISNAEETERFSAELLANPVELLDFNRDSGVITITAENGVWRYKVAGWDDSDGHGDRTVVAHLIEQP